MDRVKTSHAEIPPPEGIVFRKIDPSNGRLWRPGCAGPVREAFLEGTEPESDCRGGGRTLLARTRGNPEPAEISPETWRRWSAEPIVRRRTAPARVDADEANDAPHVAGRGGVPDIDEERKRRRASPEVYRPQRDRRNDRVTERERERASKRAEEWRKEEEKRFERLHKEREKWFERARKEQEKQRERAGIEREKRGDGGKRDKEKKGRD
jgi:hypothetical protein